MTNRLEHIDIAKGISIILVVLAHSKLKNFAPDIIDSMALFRMPLFFFLSGIFFSTSSNARTFLWKKSDALLKPYFSTLLTVTIITITILIKEGHLDRQLLTVFYGSGMIGFHPMWFLTHLFSVYCFTYFIFNYAVIQKKNSVYKLALLVLLITIGTQWIDTFYHVRIALFSNEIRLRGLPFSIDLVFISSSFFIMGAFLRKMVISFNPDVYLLFISILVFSTVVLFTDAHIDLNRRNYINPLLATTGAICGIYFVIYTSFYISKVPFLRNVFLTFGQASLFILIFHYYINSMVYNYYSKSGMYELELWYAISAFILSIIAPVLIKNIITKNKLLSLIYLPLKSNDVSQSETKSVPSDLHRYPDA